MVAATALLALRERAAAPPPPPPQRARVPSALSGAAALSGGQLTTMHYHIARAQRHVAGAPPQAHDRSELQPLRRLFEVSSDDMAHKDLAF